ncbi:glutathione S-transferase family protein [Pelagibacterium halotolerans]|uniref:Glutathione S-transferase n=1 Tax=Pelagibacterium halotolerans (strain DSM 22347 / JCM 15775 / CGMCC 1.7692 / B2) TaxID=1082931 RepID=G4REQ6_PELHB|nr:glutathione S-transferase family protein [Pelagibacterium halotolerans]AEQ50910.1 glutathione S-transferase [Pelagibacterium halotolerans B2]QJR19188.1 glutathione S-transferase family protein [Pelagibacterium halotolerans]SDZ99687.1 glutathione S-transferase [Pelagibacterium halotolerans]
MYALYIANKNYSSWSLRPWVLLKALGIDFDERFVPFLQGSSYEEFRKFSPTGLVPCLVDGDLTVWDSLAITEYVAEDHSQVWPTDRAARAWARSASAEMHSGFSALRNICGMNVGVRVRMHEISPTLQANLDRIDELWSEGLSRFGGPFLAGEVFTAVDAFFCPVAFRLQTYGLKLSDSALAYAERLRSLPAMREWYEAGLAESIRDEPHDAEIALAGTLMEDLRAV